MAAVECQTLINAPPDKVFAYVSDLQNHIHWSGAEAIRKMSEGPVAVGSTYETKEKGPFGRTRKEKSNVTQYQPNTSFGWRSFGPMGTWLDWSFELRPQDNGTLIIERMEPQSSLLTTVLMKLFVERQMRKSMPESLSKIKRNLEES